jgi:lysophospholipase L1-like esterase
MRHILFGDSIGFGVGDYQNGGWATQLRLFIDQQRKTKEHNLINLSISGDNTRLLLARMEREARLRMRDNPPQEFTILIAIGTNDSKLDKSHPEKDISIEEYEDNLRQLITIAESLSQEVILIGLLPVEEAKTTPYKENSHYLNERLAAYNQVILKVAQEKQLKFVDFFPEWKKLDLTKLFADGLHPNTEGHRMMFEKIKDQLFLTNLV